MSTRVLETSKEVKGNNSKDVIVETRTSETQSPCYVPEKKLISCEDIVSVVFFIKV